MSTEAIVCNLALAHCGAEGRIATLTEASKEARACNRVWNEAALELQSEHVYNFNTRVGVLNRLGDPTIMYSQRWPHNYRYPSDCIRFQDVLPPPDSEGTISDLVLAGRPQRIPYEVISDTTERMILTGMADAAARYSVFVPEVAKWPPTFRVAMSWRIACYILPSFVGKTDKGLLLQRSMAFYDMSISKAREVDARERVEEEVGDGDMINSRG